MVQKNASNLHSPAGQARAILALKIAAAGLSWVMFWVMARVLDVADFGLIGLAINLAALLSVVGAMGYQVYQVRALPGMGRDVALALLGKSIIRVATGTAVALAVAGVAVLVGGVELSLTYLVGFASFALAVAAADLLMHAARGLTAHGLSIWPKEIAWRLSVTLALGVFGGIAPLSAAQVIWIMAAFLAFAVLLQTVMLLRKICALPPKPHHDAAPARTKDFWISAVAGHFLANADTVIVAVILGPSIAAPYFLANRLAVFLSFFLSSENMALAPALARLHHEGNLAALPALVQASARRVTVITLAGTGILVAGGFPILSAFGSSYAAGYWPLVWLSLAVLINAASGPADIVLNMTGHERAARRNATMALIGAALLLPFGALTVGPAGVAASAALITGARKALCWHALRRHLGFRADALSAMQWGGRRIWLN